MDMIEEYLKQLYFCNGHHCDECRKHSGEERCLVSKNFECPQEAPGWLKDIINANKICETIPNSIICKVCENYKTCPVIIYEEMALDYAYHRNQPIMDDGLLLEILTK